MTQPQTRLRIHFTKRGDLRWISHRDLARVWERLLRRAGISLAFSQGFHPKPKISFPSALALGIESLDEVLELEIVGPLDLAVLQQSIAAQMPDGMQLLSIETPAAKARFVGSTFRIELPADRLESVEKQIGQLLQTDTVRVERDGKIVECSVKSSCFDLRLDGHHLLFTLPAASQGAAIRPSELLQLLNLGTLLEEGAILQRIQMHLDQKAVPQEAYQEIKYQSETEHDSSVQL